MLRFLSPSDLFLSLNLRGLVVALVLTAFASVRLSADPLPANTPVRGWTLLSENESNARVAIAASSRNQINHLQLSHRIVHDLCDVDDPARQALVSRLTDAAHEAGIEEVVLWDHALYPLDYYPDRFRTGPGRTIDLDNPEFWVWLKSDYRRLLDRVPQIDGLVLTFIETGARVEEQYSKNFDTEAARLAAVVNAVADVVVGERGLALYARTFSYTKAEYTNVLAAVRLFTRPEVKLMMKETPHDFFIPHPANAYIGIADRPTLVEFDATGEYNGQGVIASTWPELVLHRWRDVGSHPQVIGYVARTDRYGDTQIVGRAGEINLHALQQGAKDPNVTTEQIYDEFIGARYGTAAIPDLKAAFRRSLDILSATLYTLGTDIGQRHSRLNYDTHPTSYARHVSGKWMDPPVVFVPHDVNREFHYWRDVIDHLAPSYAKDLASPLWEEVPDVRTSGWIRPGDRMNEAYLRYVLAEKEFGLAQAKAALADVERAREVLRPADYEELRAQYHRTVLTARLHHAVAAAYFGFRVWCRGEEHQNEFVTSVVQRGLAGIRDVAPLIVNYPGPVPLGQWDWRKDAAEAQQYFRWITEDGWPLETKGVSNAQGGMLFPWEN